MNCPDVRQRLDVWLDGGLDPAEETEVRAHLEVCEACRREEREALELSARVAALPSEIEPARDLWSGIRNRIERAEREAPREESPARPSRIGWWAAAAAAVLAVAALVALWPGGPAEEPAVASAPGLLPGAESAAILASYDDLEDEFQRTRDLLLAELETRQESLDPETVRLVLENLSLMEEAAAEIRTALEEDPANPSLKRMLMASYRRQVGLLQKANRIPTRL